MKKDKLDIYLKHHYISITFGGILYVLYFLLAAKASYGVGAIFGGFTSLVIFLFSYIILLPQLFVLYIISIKLLSNKMNEKLISSLVSISIISLTFYLLFGKEGTIISVLYSLSSVFTFISMDLSTNEQN